MEKWTEKEKENTSKRMRDWFKNNEHPRGFKNHKHSDNTKKKLGKISQKMWNDKQHRVNSKEYRQMLSDKASKQQNFGIQSNRYSRCKQGKYNINEKKIFFRSSWEANIALYLDFLIKQKQIKKWEYEIDTFWFEKIRRGIRSYKPDFKIFNNNGTIEYWEIKGFLDSKSKTKLKRMKKYYPKIKLILIEKEEYTDIKNKIGKLLKFF